MTRFRSWQFKLRLSRGDAISRDIAQELANRNIPTPRGGHVWNAMTVMRVNLFREH